MRIILSFIIASLMVSCSEPDTLFKKIPSSHTNIHFDNEIIESDSINPIDMEFLYNGGGVAAGDFNKDGLTDLYFTGSQVSNKMYLNKGELIFEDITEKAGVSGNKRWSNAASVVDINSDGWPDIYVCTTVKKDIAERTNLLYINQGLNEEGLPYFKEMAREYNLADTGMSVHAAFFDYDRDGDLDMYLVTTTLAQRNTLRFDGGTEENKEALSDKLYRNKGTDSLGHPYFENISKEAGIQDEGFGLGVAIADINQDGWKDIYVTNDFFGSDLLYINNGNGHFADKAKQCFKHTSQNAMGNDIADINNDGLADIIAVDMNPEDNFRKKTKMNGINYFLQESTKQKGLMLQYVRNTLQLNNGLHQLDTGNQLLPYFSDISFYAGVAETDWSWNPSLADFDNDGYKDLIITNGYPKDVTDHDFGAYRSKAYKTATKKELIEQIPQVKIANYAYRNTGELKFENKTTSWGMDTPSFSDGAIYADLDNDGDLDYVINNINEEAFIYKNTSERADKNNYLNIRFNGSINNINGIGTIADIYYDHGKMQTFENSPYRGYLSTVEDMLHFGLGKTPLIDSLVVKWTDGKQQVLKNIAVNKTITVFYKNSQEPAEIKQAATKSTFFDNITRQTGIDYTHSEFDYNDFDSQRLLPHKLSQYGPSIVAGDIDNNGFDDLVIGASAHNNGSVFLQQNNGRFIAKLLPAATGIDARKPEMMGMLLFDADGDGDLDLYACSGSNEFASNTKNYQDQFYINTGKGDFTNDSTAIPKNNVSKSCIKAADFDNDGDLDLFVGGRINPEHYPEPVTSFIYRNDSENGKVRFTDVTNELAPFLQKAGLVCDAVWTDFDSDGLQDLIIAGEFMPITFLKNNGSRFVNTTTSTGLEHYSGWWNSIISGDFDNDGDMDYVAGNLGSNSFYRASEAEPVSIYSADFNDDNIYDAIPFLYLPDQNGRRREYPANVRDDVIGQMITIRRRFPDYKTFAESDINKILNEEERKKAMVSRANYFSSCLIQNNGNNRFEIKPLPALAQLAPINGMVAEDVNGDGFADLIINGNEYGNEPVNGQYDAMYGLVMLGDGQGKFNPLNAKASGYFLPGDAKGLVKLIVNNKYHLAATQNRNKLQLFALSHTKKLIRFRNDDLFAMIRLKNGRKRKVEIVYGSSFLSQSSRFMIADSSMQSIEVTNLKKEVRMIPVK
ncbi:MAG TPA: FG-GAP-like repeat-containing protein [Flavitalea sp.]|nr:FG-GAP-like repeat-containing protein [Flavitalea sp.]